MEKKKKKKKKKKEVKNNMKAIDEHTTYAVDSEVRQQYALLPILIVVPYVSRS